MPLNEANTRLHLIDPGPINQRGWKHAGYYAIRAEERDAAVEIINGKARRRATKPKDYVLYWDCTGGTTPRPLAILEAKKESLPPDHGLQQAMDYRKGALRHVPTVFSSNGHLFVRFDEKTGQISDPLPMADFPRPEDLCGEQTQFLGFSPTEPAAKPWTAPADLGPLKLLYYQDAAARATLQKIVLADKQGANPRVLLPMATGWNDQLAVAILKRLDAAGRLTRALFVCDRDPLRSSALAAMQQVFGTNADEVSTRNAQPNAKVLVATTRRSASLLSPRSPNTRSMTTASRPDPTSNPPENPARS